MPDIDSSGGGNTRSAVWSALLLAKLSAPITLKNMEKLYTWATAEGQPGGSHYNPFNTTFRGYGATVGQAGISYYPTLYDGIDATAATLQSSSYSPIVQNLRSDGSFEDFSKAVWDSPWAGSHYGYGADWPSSLVTKNPYPSWVGNMNGADVTQTNNNASSLSLPGALGDLANAVEGVLDPVDGIFAPFTNLFKLLGWITSPLNWLRIFAGLAGFLLAIGGVVAMVGVF